MSGRVRFLVGCVAVVALCSVGSSAQPEAGEDLHNLFSLSFEDLMDVSVTTLSRVAERQDDTPGVIHVFTREMIQRRGYSSLREVLQTIPGFAVFHRDLDYVGAVRGLTANDNEKFSLLINGIEMNQVNEPDFLNGPINLDNVERVEVVVGPSSLFMPANTLVATVNVITRQPDGVEVVLAKGNALDYGVTVMLGEDFGDRRSYSASLTLERRLGFDAWDRERSPAPMSNLEGEDLTGKADENYFFVATGQHGDWNAQLVSYQSRFPELQLEGYNDDRGAWYTDQMHGLNLKHEHALSSELTTIATFSAVNKQSTRQLDGGVAPAGLNMSVAQNDYNGELGIICTRLDTHRIQTGIQLGYEDNYNTYGELADRAVPRFTLVDEDTHSVGVYLSDTVTVNEDLTLVAGVRSDQNSLAGSRWHNGGRAAVIYRPTDIWTTKLMYNRAVRMPSPLAALNAAWGVNNPTAPDWANDWPLVDRPEKLSTVEWLNTLAVGKGRLSLVLYHQELKDYISWAGPHTNVGDFSGDGAELSAGYDICSHLGVWGNATYLDSTFDAFSVGGEELHVQTDTHNRLIGSPRITANAGFDWDVTRRILFSSAIRYFTKQSAKAQPGADNEDPNSFETIDDQHYVDATLTFRDVVYDGLDFRLAGKNILDNRDYVAGAWLDGQYRPRGATFELTAYVAF
jgi:outer membrane receptor for ferrienterochelin and colicin